LFKKGKSIELHSDNKNYQPYIIKHSDVVELWKFVCTLNNADTQAEDVNLHDMMQLLQTMQASIEELKKK
jgi:hypothetical protein